MKVFLCIILLAIVAGLGSASPTGQSVTNLNAETLDTNEQDFFPMIPVHGDLNRYRKSYGSGSGGGGGGGGGVSAMSAHPCPRNYLFSCAPNLSPLPCSSGGGGGVSFGGGGGGGGGYGSSGAYTAPVPVYLAPMGNVYNRALPQLYEN